MLTGESLMKDAEIDLLRELILLRAMLKLVLAQQVQILAHIKGSNVALEIKDMTNQLELIFAQIVEQRDKSQLQQMLNLTDLEH